MKINISDSNDSSQKFENTIAFAWLMTILNLMFVKLCAGVKFTNSCMKCVTCHKRKWHSIHYFSMASVILHPLAGFVSLIWSVIVLLFLISQNNNTDDFITIILLLSGMGTFVLANLFYGCYCCDKCENKRRLLYVHMLSN